jgi:hypothetical protein
MVRGLNRLNGGKSLGRTPTRMRNTHQCKPNQPQHAVFEANCLKLKSVMQQFPGVQVRPHAKV